MANIRTGEASDSDEESGANKQQQLPLPAKTKPEIQPEQAVVVLGEASESEEEEIMTDSTSGSRQQNSKLSLPISLRDSRSSLDQRSSPSTPINYKSLLHKKLRERNVALRKRIVQAAQHSHHTVSKELNAISQQLAKSHSQIQEVGPVLRILTNDLCHLEDNLEITMACASLIPFINIPKQASTVPVSP